MGTFNIIPKDFSAVTCSLNTDESSDYIVLASSIDMNERKRLEVLYATGASGGAVRKSRRGLAEITFRMAVFGTTSEALLDNYRALVTAITAERGGTIQYKPRGLGGSVLDTYYHYLQSPPPRIIRRGHLDPRSLEKLTRVGGEGGDLGILCEIKLMTQAWATSDPDALQTVVAKTTIDNKDDGGTNNCVIVPSSSIKGDCVIPVIEMAYISGSHNLLVHKREMLDGSNTNLDYLEAEGADYHTGWTITAVAGTSSGEVLRATIPAASTYTFTIPLSSSIDNTYLGKIAVIIAAKVQTGRTVDLRAKLTFTGYQWSDQDTGWVPFDGNGLWKLIYSFKELDLPPFTIPDRLTPTTSPTIGEFIYGSIKIEVKNPSASDTVDVDVDFVVVAKTNEWIAHLTYRNVPLDSGGLLLVDAITERAMITTTAGVHMDSWAKTGVAYNQLLLHKGYDTRLRFFSMYSNDLYTHSWQNYVTIKGIYVTVYPFSET